MPADDQRPRPPLGALVRDELKGRIGVLMAYGAYGSCGAGTDGEEPETPRPGAPTLAYLRPEGGGREWTAPPDAIAPLTPAEALREKLRTRNRRSLHTRL